jgi:site-specific recombinase XerD
VLSVLDRAVADLTTTEALVSASKSRVLTRAEFHGLAEMPAELEWFANIDNPRTRRSYRNDIEEFSRFVGIAKPEEMRSVTRSHLIAWRKQLELRNLAGGGHLGPHSLRATAATNALDRGSDLAKVQEWLGHANVATTRLYDRRRSRPEDSPTYRISY